MKKLVSRKRPREGRSPRGLGRTAIYEHSEVVSIAEYLEITRRVAHHQPWKPSS
jgi:hypothetical protein